MSLNSKIEWTDATWNPIRGCTKISPGCAHCYAETFAERFRGVAGHPYEQGFDLKLIPEKLGEPLRWPKSKMVFVNSMSDLFHEGVADDYIEQVCRVMQQASWHTFQVLTKRSERMRDLLNSRLGFAARRAAHLVRGERREQQARLAAGRALAVPRLPACGCSRSSPCSRTWARLDSSGIGWVILGGESGPGCPADGGRLGAVGPRPVPGRERAFLLQAVGRRAQEASRPRARRPDA